MGRVAARRGRRLLNEPRAPRTRRAGTGLLASGQRVTWTVAGGTRGRRWRWTTVGADGRLLESGLLETTPDGALSKLEAAGPAGLLTLHPEGTWLHGNIVRPSGIEHVALPWHAGDVVLVARSPLAAAAAAAGLGARVGVGEGRAIGGVEVDGDLAVRPATWRVARVAADRWWFTPADRDAPVAVTLDSSGVPVLGAASSWPLELDRAAGEATSGDRTVDGVWITAGEHGPNAERRG